jgi:N-acetylglutamate synthase-like GNAT family acetyltransferase
MMIVRQLTPEDRAAVIEIANGLPEWFDEHARTKGIPVDVAHQEGFVTVDGGTITGFITLYVAEGKLMIGWMGVRNDCRRGGAGTALIRRAEERARELGIEELATWTLGDGVDYQPYDETRAFYYKNGFHIYQRSQTDNPGCPEEIKISKRVL